MLTMWAEWVRGLVWVWRNFFAVEVLLFWLFSGRCSGFCVVFWALFAGVLMALSMLVSVTFGNVERLCGKSCVRVSVDVALVTLTCAVLMGLRAG